jgi:hypothetical protein
MSGRFKISVIAAVMALSCSGCSDSGTGPDAEIPPVVYGGLVIGYITDDAAAASGDISPEAGGTVVATGSNGVAYTLAVSPGAVGSMETVTITPLSKLTIGIKDSSEVDTSACLVGAMFEPTGLVFDSTAVLTVTYSKSGLNCTLTDEFCIVHIDSSEAFYEIIPTTVNPGVPSLTCTITHFSGYGTDDPDYGFLKHLIEQTAKYGQDFPGDDVLGKLMSYAGQAAGMGWDDLRDLAWQGSKPILDYLVTRAIHYAQQDPGESTLTGLRHYLDPAIAMGFTDIEGRLRIAIDRLVRDVAANGNALCGQGDHAQGKALLRKALEWAMAGAVSDPAFIEQIDEWLSDCGDITVVLSADKLTANTGTLTTVGAEAAIVTFYVTVTSVMGDPIEDCTVHLHSDGGGGFTVCSHQGGGVYTAMITGSAYGGSSCPPHELTRNFHAEVTYKGKRHVSDVLPIIFLDLKITSSMTYSYTYNYRYDTAFRSANATVIGGGMGCYGWTGECSGTMTRSYMSSYNGGTKEAVDHLIIPACKIFPYFEAVPIEGTNLAVQMLTTVNVDICYAFNGITMLSCPADDTCSTYETDLSVGNSWTQLAMPFGCGGMGGGLYFNNDGSGSFEPYTWDYSIGDEYFSRIANLGVDVAAEF